MRYEGSNPSLCTRIESEPVICLAFAAYDALGVFYVTGVTPEATCGSGLRCWRILADVRVSDTGAAQGCSYIRIRTARSRRGLTDVAQLVEHSLGKGEVTSSIPVIGSRVEVVSLARW